MCKGLSSQFCLSVSLSVSLVKIFEISTFTGFNNCNLKTNNVPVCVPDGDESSSLLCISSSFLFNIGIVHHFDAVNHLDTVETRHMRIPSMCSRSQASLLPGLRKAWWGCGNDATHSLDLTIHTCGENVQLRPQFLDY